MRIFSATAWNLAGVLIPLVVALWSVSYLLDALGVERYGFVTLAWALIGYFGIFDLGLGRALTSSISKRVGEKNEYEIPSLVKCGCVAVLLITIAVAIVFFAFIPNISTGILNIPEALQKEVEIALAILALTIPITALSAVSTGVLAGFEKFAHINKTGIPLSTLINLAPCASAAVSESLIGIAAALFAARVLLLVVRLYYTKRELSQRYPEVAPVVASHARGSHARELLAFGGWLSVSNLLAPIMVNFDRFAVGSILTLRDVATYATPMLLAGRLAVFANALSTSIFPRLSRSGGDTVSEARIFWRSIIWTIIITTPPVLILISLSYPIMALWINDEMAQNAYTVLAIAAIGMFGNAIAQIPAALLQAKGRPDITAKIHLGEVPIYAVALIAVLPSYGITGAAIVWASRMWLDCIVMFLMAWRIFPKHFHIAADECANVVCTGLVALGSLCGAVALTFHNPVIEITSWSALIYLVLANSLLFLTFFSTISAVDKALLRKVTKALLRKV